MPEKGTAFGYRLSTTAIVDSQGITCLNLLQDVCADLSGIYELPAAMEKRLASILTVYNELL
jgi:hypothetical protein